MLVDESRRDLRDPENGRPIRVYDWSPRAEPGASLIVVSHGTGGSGRDMGWLTLPLVAEGFRVLSLDHHGNNHVDGYHPEGFVHAWERPRDLTFLLDCLGEQGDAPVGVAGFSVGGYTAVALAGARMDGGLVAAVLDGTIPVPPIEELPDAFDRLRAESTPDDVARAAARASADLRDPRVRAVFLVAPGISALLTTPSLETIDIPVEIRWGDADPVNPFDQDVRPLLEHIPTAAGREVGPGVDHHDFIEPLRPDRPAARHQVGADAAAFFTEHLGPPAPR
jgi:predicted dienelactone hydrolase